MPLGNVLQGGEEHKTTETHWREGRRMEGREGRRRRQLPHAARPQAPVNDSVH